MATELKVFSLKWYLDHNPDVAAAVAQGLVDAFQHFEQYGKAEGRSMGPLFDVDLYLAQNPDVAAAVERGETTAYDHFIQYGAGEDRTPSALFDEAFYLLQNPDVAAAVQAGTMTAVQHFLSYGQSEPRPFNPSIDLGAYLEANPDVAAAVQNGFMSAMEHLMVYGAGEARDLGNGVNLGMFANDGTFQQALSSGDIAGALLRVGEVAPFLPTFQPPAGWTPPPDTPIPVDFVPPAGIQLVIPPSVIVPPGTELPPTFTPPTPTPGGGGGSPSPTFTVTLGGDGTLTFSGTATGDIIMTVDDGGVATFVRGSVTASLKPNMGSIHNIVVEANTVLQAAEDVVSSLSRIDLVNGGKLRVETNFTPLGDGNQKLESANIAQVYVDDMNGPAAVWDSVLVTSNDIADKFKLFWVTGDEGYYAALALPPEDKIQVNDAILELGAIYAEYLRSGNLPILDVVQTKMAGEPDYHARKQSLHDNLLGNLNSSVIQGRVSRGEMTDPGLDADDAAFMFGGRPVHDGKETSTASQLATQVWDAAHGIERSDFGDEASVYLMSSAGIVSKFGTIQNAVNDAQNGDVLYVGSGNFDENINVAIPGLHVVLSPDAKVLGGFVIRSSADGFHLSGSGRIEGGMDVPLIAGSAHKAIYVQSNADVTIEGVTIFHAGDRTGQLRGIEVEGGHGNISVDGVTIQGWVTGIYANPGNQLTVTDSTLSNSTVGIGVDGPAELTVSGNKFAGNQSEDIGLTPGKTIGDIDIFGNEYSGGVVVAINNGANTGLLELHGTNVLLGAAGNDVLTGASGSQTILGLSGNDIIRGDGTPLAGQQYLPASYGHDCIDGGMGTNILILGTAYQDIQLGGQDTIIAGGANQGKDVVFNFNFGPVVRYDSILPGGHNGVEPTSDGADKTFDIVAFQMTMEAFIGSATILFGQAEQVYRVPTEFVLEGTRDWSGNVIDNVGGAAKLFTGAEKEYELVVRFDNGDGGELVFANALSRFEKAGFLKALDETWNNLEEVAVNTKLDDLEYEDGDDPSAGLVTLTAEQALKMVEMMTLQGNFTFLGDSV